MRTLKGFLSRWVGIRFCCAACSNFVKTTTSEHGGGRGIRRCVGRGEITKTNDLLIISGGLRTSSAGFLFGLSLLLLVIYLFMYFI